MKRSTQPSTAPSRAQRLLAQARNNPNVATQLCLALPPDSQLVLAERLALPARTPGLKKCGAGAPEARRRSAANNGFTAQLTLFARSVSRVAG